MCVIHGARFEDEQARAIGAHDFAGGDFEVDFWMAIGAVAAITGYGTGFDMDDLGRIFVGGIRHSFGLSASVVA